MSNLIQIDDEHIPEKELQSKKIKLEDFKLICPIGEGAFGEVYLVKHYFTNNSYALKLIDKQFLTKQKKEHHIYSEKVILRHLKSKSVVKLYATFQDDKKLYFLMENIPNGELSAYLRLKSEFRRKVAAAGSYVLCGRDCEYIGVHP